jgi:hypothetical protein
VYLQSNHHQTRSCTLSQLLTSNRNAETASALTLASGFIPRRLSGLPMRRQYAVFNVTLIASRQCFAMSMSTTCDFVRRQTLEESQSSGSPLLTCLLTALQSYFLNRNMRTLYANLAWRTFITLLSRTLFVLYSMAS